MGASPAKHPELLRFLQDVPFVSETFPDPSPLRRILAVGGRWSSESTDSRALVMMQWSTLLIHTRAGNVLECILQRNFDETRWPELRRGDMLEVSQASLNRFARDFDLLESTGSHLANARATEITLLVSNQRTKQVAGQIEAQLANSCNSFARSDRGITWLAYKILDGHYDWQDTLEVHDGVLTGIPKWQIIHQELQSFAKDLDQESVAICQSIDWRGIQLYAYLRYDGSALTRRSRHEAIRRFPFLATYIASNNDIEAAAMRASIDQGRSPIGPRGSAIVVSRDTMKAVTGKSKIDLGLEYEDEDPPFFSGAVGPWGFAENVVPSRMFRWLAMVPAKQYPSRRTQWMVFQEFSSRMGRKWYAAEAIGRNLLRCLARMGWPLTVSDGASEVGIDLLLDDLNDLFQALGQGLYSAACAEVNFAERDSQIESDLASACAAEIEAFASRTELQTLASMNHRWHLLYGHALAALDKEHGYLPVTKLMIPLLRDRIEIDGLSIVQLLTDADFHHEGSAMRHCVGTLVDHGRAEEAAYFSVRSATGARISTFDLSFRSTGWRPQPVLNNHRGPKNGRPSQEAVAAVQEFCRRLGEGAWREAVEEYVERVSSSRFSGDTGSSLGLTAAEATANGEAEERAELLARLPVASAVLQDHFPKMLKNVLREVGRSE